MVTQLQDPRQLGVNPAALENQFDNLQRLVAAEAAELPQQPDLGASPQPTWAELRRLFLLKLKTSFQTDNPRATAKKYAAFALGLILIGLVPWPHYVTCNVICEPVVHRFVAAPFDGKLLRSNVLVGQQVKQGEVLAILDGGELNSQLAGARAKLAQSEQRRMAALSTSDHSKSEFERLEVEHLRREIELLESRKVDLEVRSPMDGIVISGDLERAEGAPLAVGDNLFEIASLDRLVAEVAIPESDISFVAKAMEISVKLDSVPENTFDTTVQRIHFRNEIRDNQSVFIAETELPNDSKLLRPGMNGEASIKAGYRPLGWLLFHRPYNAIRHWIGW